MAHWLFKTEPGSYTFADLMAEPERTTGWDGVRNYQARNILRDEVAVGDGILFYHSNSDPPGIAGLAEIVRAGHPDQTAFDPNSPYHDPKSDPGRPTWFQVSVRAVRSINPPVSLPILRTIPALASMELLRKGNRLSVQHVSPEEWAVIQQLIDVPNRAG